MVEVQLLNYILETKDFQIVTQNALTAEMFVQDEKVFKFIEEHYHQYKVVPDKLSVLDKFEDFDITEVKESPEYLVAKLYEEYQFRKGAPKLQEAFDVYKDDSNRGIEKLKEILPSLIYQPYIKVNSLVHNATKRLEKYKERAANPLKNYITTGFAELDKIIGGWDREEEYALLIARPGKGKSWIAVKCAAAAAIAGFKVLYYSGEIGDDMLGYRFDTVVSNLSNYKLTHSDVSIMTEYEKAIEEFSKISGDLIVVTPADLGGLMSVSKLRALVELHKPDIIFIDQISLMNDDKKGKTDTERTSNISKDLKTLQSEKRLPIIAVSQVNRGEQSKGGPGTENISNSDRLGQDATVVISIDRKETDLLLLRLTKSRFSSSGEKLCYKWKIDKGEHEYIPTEGESLQDNSSKYSEERRKEKVKEADDLRNQFKDRNKNVF